MTVELGKHSRKIYLLFSSKFIPCGDRFYLESAMPDANDFKSMVKVPISFDWRKKGKIGQ